MSYCARTSLPDSLPLGLIEEARPHWEQLGLRLHSRHLPYEDRVILTIRYLRQGITQAELAEEYCVGQTTVSGIIREVLPVLVGLGVQTRYGEVLHGLDDTMEYLARHGSTALLDGTLIRGEDVEAPGHFSGKHQQPGKNVQVISDVGGQPLWCSEPLPGACNDSRAARECGVIDAAREHGVTLVTDLGYARTYALVPHRRGRGRRRRLTREQLAFNSAHSRIRCAVERAIRRIKTWRLLHRRSHPVHLLGLVLGAILMLESRRLWA